IWLCSKWSIPNVVEEEDQYPVNKQANAVAPILSQALAKRRQLSVDSPVEAIIRPYAHPDRVARSSGPDTRDPEVLRSLLLAASLPFRRRVTPICILQHSPCRQCPESENDRELNQPQGHRGWRR